MAPLVFQFAGREIPLSIEKVDRTKLYGTVRHEATDMAGNPCRLATLAPDGRTLLEAGGLAQASLSEDNYWFDKSALHAVDREGRPVEPVASSFKASIPLTERVSVEEYLNHNIHAVYLLSAAEGGALDADLAAELKAGHIFGFPFSYRGGLTADAAFLLAGADGAFWMAVGKRATIEFLAPDQVAPPEDDEEAASDEDDDSLDFGMM